MKRIIISLFSILAILALIVKNSLLLPSLQKAVSICIYSLIPTIFPFLVISSIITLSGSASAIGRLFSPIFKKLLRVNDSSCAVILLGWTSGFPIGAISSYNLYKDGEISKEEAEYLLSFCSNSGISFIFGIIGGLIFKDIKIAVIIFIIQIVSSFFTGFLLRPHKSLLLKSHAKKQKKVIISNVIIESVKKSVIVMSQIAGYFLFFYTLTEIIMLFLPQQLSIVIKGIFELTSASFELSTLPTKTAVVVVCGLLSWTGICVHMQVYSVVNQLSMKKYFLGKIIHMAISMSIAMLIPIEEYLPVYRENITIAYRQNNYTIMFILIIFIIIYCFFSKINVK